MTAALRTKRVFINCPFDGKYKPIFDAIVFALHDLGFVAIFALNKSGGGALRLPRIYKQLSTCAYSIHDLSRISLTGPRHLPRFNMPFEAGLAYGLHQDPGHDQDHQLLVLDSKPHRYQASISDLAGLDPAIHGDNPVKAIAAVRTFFAQYNPSETYNPAPFIQRRYFTFMAQLPAKSREMNLSARLLRSWDYALDLQNLIAGWVQANP